MYHSICPFPAANIVAGEPAQTVVSFADGIVKEVSIVTVALALDVHPFTSMVERE